MLSDRSWRCRDGYDVDANCKDDDDHLKDRVGVRLRFENRAENS